MKRRRGDRDLTGNDYAEMLREDKRRKEQVEKENEQRKEERERKKKEREEKKRQQSATRGHMPNIQ